MSNRTATAAAVALAAIVVAACGGGDDSPSNPPATASVPPSASASGDGFIAYLKELVASTMTDALEPVDTAAVTPPPADETGEPQKVD